MADAFDGGTQRWWAAPDVIDEIQVTLDHVNQSRERSSLSAGRLGWELDACGDLFNALNRLWSTRAHHFGDLRRQEASAPRQLAALLRELPEADRTTLLGMPSIEALAEFEPAIFDHSIVGRTQRIADITEETRREADAEHRHFTADWSRWRERGSGVSATLESLSRIVLVVRNNRFHGEKTAAGPDHDRTHRNREVASVILKVLEDLVDFLLDHPSRKLAAYGTLRPGERNYEILKDIVGVWAPVRLTGVLNDTGLPAFSFSTAGSAIAADLLISADLASHWPRLDGFEGSGYTRQLGLAWHEEAPLVANVYVVSPN